MASWAGNINHLHKAGTITGFALITNNGPAQPTAGIFERECSQGVPSGIQALIRPFYTACEPPTTHTLEGLKLHVIQQTDSYYVAISKQRQLGLIAINLPLGVLLATFNRALHPAAALAAVQGASRTGPVHTQYTPSYPAGAVAAAAATASPVSAYS